MTIKAKILIGLALSLRPTVVLAQAAESYYASRNKVALDFVFIVLPSFCLILWTIFRAIRNSAKTRKWRHEQMEKMKNRTGD